MSRAIHHVAIICSDYENSKRFYTQILGLSIAAEHYRKERKLNAVLSPGTILKPASIVKRLVLVEQCAD